MSEKKVTFKLFSVPEWVKEQNYLSAMHQQGWKFTKVNLLGCYHFVKCPSEDVVYQLDYNPDGIAQKEAYVQMFRDCGWEYLQDYVGYSYFRKPAAEMQGREEIFCDDTSRLEMMKRVFRGRMLPLLIFFFLVLLPNLYVQSMAENYILSAVYSLLLLLYLYLFVRFGVQFWRYRNTLSQ